MLTSYFSVLFRNILKNKIFSFVNFGGLALGLSCFTIIVLFVENELSYDRFHRDPENVYRIVRDFVDDAGNKVPDATTPPALSHAMKQTLSELESVTRLFPNRGRLYLMQYRDKSFYETEVLRIDSSFFSVFNFPFISGSKESALSHVHSMLLSQSTARKYFGDQDAVGKIIRVNVNNGTDYIVTGVLKDVPQNSHFTFDVVIPFESGRNADVDWNWNDFYTYARIKSGVNPVPFEIHIKSIVKQHQPTSKNEFHIQKLTDIHLYSRLKSELSANGDILNVKALIIIGVFIILIAGINYVNLVTAQSIKRAKEVGVRKITGALKRMLVRQFLTESVLTVFLSLALSIIFTTLLLPVSRGILGYDLSLAFSSSPYVRIILPSCALLIGLLAGLYPAFFLSSFKPLNVLRGGFIHSGRGIRLRQGLVVFQFIISTIMIVGTLIVSEQLDFMKRKDPGFNKDHVMLLPNVRGGIGNPTAGPEDKIDSMKKVPGVVSIARADGIFGYNNATKSVRSISENRISLNFMRVDYEFFPTLELELKEGRNFSDQFISDAQGIVLNETAVEQLGLKPPYLGQQIIWDDNGSSQRVTLIGIVKDFQFTSLREVIRPFGFILEVGNGSNFFLKLSPQDLGSTIGDLEKIWTSYSPEMPFEYSFQDEYLARLNVSESRFLKLFSWFTLLAILIACLGLFGLVTVMANAKTKEIGIRKVLGASVRSIIGLLSREFLFTILIALVIASPIAFYFVHGWLQTFAYRIEIGWQVFVITAVASLAIASIPVSFQAIRAALTKPVDSLRRE